jgi:peptidoglycan hydrolase-like protein with peptidoglycan-binding domain
MRGNRVSKIVATLMLLGGAFILQAPALGASQTTGPQSAASATTGAKTTGTATGNSAAKKVVPKTRVIRRRKPRQKVQLAPTPQRISDIQSALAAQGTYKGQPNGKWDGATIQGMRDFQASHGLTATGKLDAPTLQKLGLGSEIAGRAAPLPLPQTPAGNPSTGPSTGQQTP